ncbi:hypothetical protein ACHAXT_002917 [Thalassiosira profunda]
MRSHRSSRPVDEGVRRSIQAALDHHHTLRWWALLCTISVLNVALWIHSYRSLIPPDVSSINNHRHPYQRHHLLLSGVYVFVCAYRSFLPRIDLERYCLWDTCASSIFLGRLAATVAEISFAMQISLFLHHLGEVHDHPAACHLGMALVPLIAVAQGFCWCGVVTLNHVHHAIEESIWAVCGALAGCVLGSLAVCHSPHRELYRLGVLGCAACFAFSAYMVSVDVPIFFDGGKDAMRRRVVTKSWEVWKEETVWLTGYFSSAVWLSLLMVHYPAPAP